MYKQCALRINQVFPKDNAHSILRFCYTSIINLYYLGENIASSADYNLYSNKLSQWTRDHEEKELIENDFNSKTWLGGLENIENEWNVSEILKSNNKVKQIVRLLLEKNNITKYNE